jgi:hypothetical protein
MSQYLGRGSTSRGVLSINGALNMYVSKVPYLHTQEDIDVVIKGIENLQKAIAKVPGIIWEVPAPNVTARDFVNGVSKCPLPYSLSCLSANQFWRNNLGRIDSARVSIHPSNCTKKCEHRGCQSSTSLLNDRNRFRSQPQSAAQTIGSALLKSAPIAG